MVELDASCQATLGKEAKVRDCELIELRTCQNISLTTGVREMLTSLGIRCILKEDVAHMSEVLAYTVHRPALRLPYQSVWVLVERIAWS